MKHKREDLYRYIYGSGGVGSGQVSVAKCIAYESIEPHLYSMICDLEGLPALSVHEIRQRVKDEA